MRAVPEHQGKKPRKNPIIDFQVTSTASIVSLTAEVSPKRGFLASLYEHLLQLVCNHTVYMNARHPGKRGRVPCHPKTLLDYTGFTFENR